MSGWKFLQRFDIGSNKARESWEEVLWSGVVPYHLYHKRRKQVFKFVAEYHFERYCGPSVGKKKDRLSRARKLYWRLHKNER